MLLLLSVAALLWTGQARAQTVISFLSPTNGQTASGQLSVRVRILFQTELVRVNAKVEGRIVDLRYSPLLGVWTNTLSVEGLAFGSHLMTVQSQDFMGRITEAFQTFRVDNPPVLTVRAPSNATVVRGYIHIDASAVDDDSNTIIRVQCPVSAPLVAGLARTNRVNEDFPVTGFSGPAVITWTATDSGGNKAILSRNVVLEPSSNLTVKLTAPGFLYDFDRERYLYGSQADTVLSTLPVLSPWPWAKLEPRILNRLTGETVSSRPYLQSFLEGPLDPGRPEYIAGAYLARPQGALLWSGVGLGLLEPMMFAWREMPAGLSLLSLEPFPFQRTDTIEVVGATTFGYTWPPGSGVAGFRLALRDIIDPTLNLDIPASSETRALDLAPNLDFVFITSNTVYRSRVVNATNREMSILASSLTGPSTHLATDGTNVVYDVQSANLSAVNIRLITPTGEVGLVSWPATLATNISLKALNGWVAYAKPGSTGQAQIWTRSPAGTEEQRTSFSGGAQIESLGPHGQVSLRSSDGARFLSFPGMPEPIWVNSGQGRATWIDDELAIVIGDSVMVVRLGRLSVASLGLAGLRLSFAGPTNFSYTLQRSTDLTHWEDLWNFTPTLDGISWTNPPPARPEFYRTVTIPPP